MSLQQRLESLITRAEKNIAWRLELIVARHEIQLWDAVSDLLLPCINLNPGIAKIHENTTEAYWRAREVHQALNRMQPEQIHLTHDVSPDEPADWVSLEPETIDGIAQEADGRGAEELFSTQRVGVLPYGVSFHVIRRKEAKWLTVVSREMTPHFQESVERVLCTKSNIGAAQAEAQRHLVQAKLDPDAYHVDTGMAEVEFRPFARAQ
jgi:hypothetical protein